jgi:hypothetical protein
MKKWIDYMVFHWAFDEQNLLMSIAINLQLMRYWIYFCDKWILPMVLSYNLNPIRVVLSYNLSICWWNYFAINVHLWMELFCAYCN